MAERPPIDIADLLRRAFAAYRERALPQAEALFAEVLAAKPDQYEALLATGVISLQRGQDARALELIRSALAINPDAAEAHFHLGVGLGKADRHDEALASFDRTLALAPGFAMAHYNRGNSLRSLGRPDEALAAYRTALSIKPDLVEALNNCGMLLINLGRYAEAIAAFDQALAINPNQIFALNNRGLALTKLHRHHDALNCFTRAVAITPSYANAFYNRANPLRELGLWEAAIADYDQALALAPDHPYALAALAEAELHICKWDRMDALARALEEGIDSGKLIPGPLALLMFAREPERQLKAIASYASAHVPRTAHPMPARPARHGERIRIAYLSADFREHAVSALTAELYERHDRSRFEVIGISYGPDSQSEMRARLIAAFDSFHDVKHETDRAIAERIYRSGIDIVVDLTGLTEFGRPGILAQRPAPIQVSWLGYTASMGVDFMDYIIADRIALPFELQPFFGESIVHLPDCYLAHDSRQAISLQPPSRAEAGLPAEGFVFCCFNQSCKITPAVFDVWMRLLHAVEGSVLWLARKYEPVVPNLRREAVARGIDPARLIFAARVPRLADHLARYRHAGLFLDTIPYNANTTAIDALWAGVPVVTCLGGTFVGRGASSALHAAGLPELVTDNLQDYEALAVRLAADRAQLAAVRDKLSRNRGTCALFDGNRFRRNIEAAYRRMWEMHVRGDSPHAFSVNADETG
jgi:protein O-GlcNAc transferase